jgi:hypothetical protein
MIRLRKLANITLGNSVLKTLIVTICKQWDSERFIRFRGVGYSIWNIQLATPA